MGLKIYNTLTRQKEDFEPITQGKVSIYNCGPTVYSYFHIGNARNFVIFDCIRKYLRYKKYDVTFVQNITDIDDKIIKKSLDEGISWKEIVSKYTTAYWHDRDTLKIEKPDHEPKATDHIPAIIEMIAKLIERDYAYEKDGNVYYRVDKFAGYGKLSGKKIDELIPGARVDVVEHKDNPLDFVLWKKAKSNEPFWESPWGSGRPGWHIECSAMSMKYLGESFDIHGGGVDLIFPHHENEIAQSEGATGKNFVKYWIHNGHLHIAGEKMSKSLGNFLMVKELIEYYSPSVIRCFLLLAHYRNPLDFGENSIFTVKEGYEEFSNTFFRIKEILEKSNTEIKDRISDQSFQEIEKLRNVFLDAMDDDFNTALALSILFKLAKKAKQLISDKELSINPNTAGLLMKIEKTLYELSAVLGLSPADLSLDAETRELISKREEKRKQKNWAEADAIRKQLEQKGVVLEDTPAGTIAMKKGR